MGRYDWLNKLKAKEYIMPFVIDKDKEYKKSLQTKLEFVCKDIKVSGAETLFVSHIESICNKLKNSLDLYYKGELWAAHMDTDDIINGIPKEKPAFASINDTYQLWGNGTNVQLFRARLGERMVDFPAEEMLHIPFDLRSKVRTERFSIPGLPCLYLGNTSYSCWIEMGSPDDAKFNVSPVLIEKDMMVLNLAVSIRHIFKWYEELDESRTKEDTDKELITWLTLLILTIATSYAVKEENREFKSEYIIPQMIMLACKSNGMDGIVYISKKVSEEIFGMTVAVNVALFAIYEGEEKYSKICENIKTADSFNFAMYNRILMNSLKYKRIETTVRNSPLIKNIGTYGRQLPYGETAFSGFDEFLFTGDLRKIEM